MIKVAVLLCGAFAMSGAAHSACFAIYDSKNILLERSTVSPIPLSGSIGDAVQQRFPGATMIITNENCPHYDHVAAAEEAKARAQRRRVDEEVDRQNHQRREREKEQKAKMSALQLDGLSDDQCRDLGDDAAKAGYANRHTLVAEGSSLGLLMKAQCGERIKNVECQKFCEDGFRYRLRKFMEN
jgi:hypothetical protein